MPENVIHADIDKQRVLLEQFVYSVNDYERIVKTLPLTERIKHRICQKPSSSDLSVSLSDKEDTAISVRLMLQRKFFVRGKGQGDADDNERPDRMHVRQIIAVAKDLSTAFDAAQIEAELDRLSDLPLQIGFDDPNDIRNGYYKNAEDLLYGVLLHSEGKRIEHIAKLNERGINLTAIVAPYVVKREQVLFNLRDELVKSNIQKYAPTRGKRGVVIRWEELSDADMRIRNSPYWKNLAGRDATLEDLLNTIPDMNWDDKVITMVCMAFAHALSHEPFNIEIAAELISTATKDDWVIFLKPLNFSNILESQVSVTKALNIQNFYGLLRPEQK